MSVSPAQLIQVFGRIGLLSFGGPAAQIALMHRELVAKRPWLNEQQFLGALSFCMLLPGPEAMQLATYCGWRLRGWVGGVIAGLLFVLPGACVVFALAVLYGSYGTLPAVQGVFLGIKATVIVVVIQALRSVAAKALQGTAGWSIAVLSFLGIFVLDLSFPVIILAAALWGAWQTPIDSPPSTARLSVKPQDTARTFGIGVAIWAAPLALCAVLGAPLLLEIGLFFSKLAVVTFGGAYAVLAYMTQEVVQTRGWLTTAQMMDGLGLAETTPGPLILVTEFVGALVGHGTGGWTGALAAAALTLWVTFVPCFLWIFAGAPYLEWITGQPRLKHALQAVTAAVVGVIANLSLWFAAHVFFRSVGVAEIGPAQIIVPLWHSLDPLAGALAALAGLLLIGLRWPLVGVLAVMAALGWVASTLPWEMVQALGAGGAVIPG